VDSPPDAWRFPSAWGRGPRPDLSALLPERSGQAPVPDPSLLVRWINIDASPETVWLWLCQLRRAPYSYDWLDNAGRRSPRIPRRDLASIAAGDRVMTIFAVQACEPGRSFDLRLDWPPRWPIARRLDLFGPLTMRYGILPARRGSQLACALMWSEPPKTAAGRFGRECLAAGDAVMMRKQLITLAALSAQWERSGFAAPAR
jgi:hypothetical protein